MINLFKSKKTKRVKPNTVSVSLVYNDKGNYTNVFLSKTDGQGQRFTREFLYIGNQLELKNDIFNSIDEWLSDMVEDAGFKE